MIKPYEATCADPECGKTFTIDADPKVLAEDNGTETDCPECGADCEYDYDPVTDTLVITPGQEFEDDAEEGDLPEDQEGEEEESEDAE